MSTPRVNHAAPVTRWAVAQRVFARRPFVLADVGVSGGIASHWRTFEPDLAAHGFDPLILECQRLAREEKNPRIAYHDCFIGSGGAELVPVSILTHPTLGWSNQPFERTSAARAQRQTSMSAAQWFNNQNPDVRYSARRSSIDAFFGALPEVSVDFIKVDTDGHDYEVLYGAQGTLDMHPVLGVLVEMQFHGVSHPHSNLFANIDRLLRERGFSLFDLETHRYTRAALPGHFVYPIPAQTWEGQILAADALYLRDIGAPGYEQRWGVLEPDKVLKLVCLHEMFGMPDCAAEVLSAKEPLLAGQLDVGPLLDLLAREIHPGASSFAAVNQRFSSNLNSFYPQARMGSLRRHLPHSVKRLLTSLRRKLQT